jgi:hypothetical protein
MKAITKPHNTPLQKKTHEYVKTTALHKITKVKKGSQTEFRIHKQPSMKMHSMVLYKPHSDNLLKLLFH